MYNPLQNYPVQKETDEHLEEWVALQVNSEIQSIGKLSIEWYYSHTEFIVTIYPYGINCSNLVAWLLQPCMVVARLQQACIMLCKVHTTL